jgi:hypothetical protein
MTRVTPVSRLAPPPPKSSPEALAAQASAIVACACRDAVRHRGEAPATDLLREMIVSAAHVLAGRRGRRPAVILRELAEDLDDQ